MPIGGWELVLVLVIVLVIFGPGKLPDIGAAVGRGIREFRKASTDLESSVRGEPQRTDPPRRDKSARAEPTTAAEEAGTRDGGGTTH